MSLYRNVSSAPVDLPDGRVLGVGQDAELNALTPDLAGRLVETASAPAADADADQATGETTGGDGPPDTAPKKTRSHHSK